MRRRQTGIERVERRDSQPDAAPRSAPPPLTALPAGRLRAGDAAYDSDDLRRFLTERGAMRVIPNNPMRKLFMRAIARLTGCATSSNECFAGSRTGVTSPPAMTSSPQTSPLPLLLPLSSSGGPD